MIDPSAHDFFGHRTYAQVLYAPLPPKASSWGNSTGLVLFKPRQSRSWNGWCARVGVVSKGAPQQGSPAQCASALAAARPWRCAAAACIGQVKLALIPIGANPALPVLVSRLEAWLITLS